MPRFKKRSQGRGLSDVQTWITDTGPFSDYFRLTQIPDVIPGGKSGFLINGTPGLVQSTEVLVELTDANGTAIFTTPIKNYQEGLARVVSIEIYDDTPPGQGLLTILGELTHDKDGNRVPDEWIGTYNVKWQKIVNIEPTKPNNTAVRLYNRPVLTIQEQLVPYRQSATGSLTAISSSGVLTGRFIDNSVTLQDVGNGTTARIVTEAGTQLLLNSPTFTREFVNGELRANYSSSAGQGRFTASIDSIQSSYVAHTPLYVTSSAGPVPQWTSTNYTMSYTSATSYITSSLNRSIARINLSNLTTFTGDIQRAKFYVRGIDEGQRYELLEDVLLESVDFTTTQSSTGEQIEVGEPRDQVSVNTYWESGLVRNASYISTASVQSTYTSTVLLDAVHLTGNDVTSGSSADTPLFWVGPTIPMNLESNVEYTLTADLVCIKPTTTNDVQLDIRLDGSTVSSGPNNELGQLISQLTVPAASTRQNFRQYVVNFTTTSDSSTKLRFLMNGGDWYIANVHVKSARDTGFNPDEISIDSSIIGRRFEYLQFKAELYDAENRLIPLQIETDPIYFDGGNLVFRGNDTRIDGLLTVAPSGSGPTLSSLGYYTSGGAFVNGQSISIGQVPPRAFDANTPFFVGTSSVGPEISFGDKLYGYVSASEFILRIDGTLLIVTGSDTLSVNSLFPRIDVRTDLVSTNATTFRVSASAQDPLNLVPAVLSYTVQPSGSVTVSPIGNEYDISRPVSGNIAQVIFYGSAPNRYSGSSTFTATPLPTSSSIQFLKLLLTVSASNSESVGLSGSVVDAYGSTMGFGLVSTSNVGTPVRNGTSAWTIPRPVAGFGSVTMVVSASDAAIVADYDTLHIQAAQAVDELSFLQLNLTITSSTLTTLGVSASVSSTALPYAFGVVTSSNIGSLVSDGVGKWTIGRPTSGEGSVTFIVTGSNSLVVSDRDTVYVSRDPAPYITVRATNLQSTQTSVTASVDVYDSNNQTGTLSGITVNIVSSSLAGLSATLSGSVSQSSGKNTYVYHISRPVYGQGTGRITAIAQKSGYTQDSDSLEIPERVDGIARLRTVIVPFSSSNTEMVLKVVVTDSIPLTGSYIHLSVVGNGVGTITPNTSSIVSESAETYYTIRRPVYGAGMGRVTFSATASVNRASDSDAFDVMPSTQQAVSPSFANISILSATSGSASVNIVYTFPTSSTAQYVSVWALESSGSTSPSASNVEYIGYQIVGSPLTVDDGRSQLSVPIAIPGNWLRMSFVPYDQLNRRGTATNVVYRSTETNVAAPSAWTSPTYISASTSTITNRLTIPTSPASFIRTYRNGTIFGSDTARTASAGTTQAITHTGLNVATSYTWEYTAVESGAESVKTSAISSSTSVGGTLNTPSLTFDGVLGTNISFTATAAPGSPSNTQYTLYVYNSSVVLIGTTGPQTSPTLTYDIGSTPGQLGYAGVVTSATNYSNSAESTQVSWDNIDGEPF